MRTRVLLGVLSLTLTAGAGCKLVIGWEAPVHDDAGAGPSCSDSTHNGTETDVDCGGSCTPCADGKGCHTGADCVSKSCGPNSVCLKATCDDKVENALETDIDCGGVTCDPCGPDKKCLQDQDCKSGTCTAGKTCLSTCNDGLKGGDETDVDCGGGCNPCADGRACLVAHDCSSGVCDAHTCAPYHIWSRGFGSGAGVLPAGVAVDQMGRGVVAATLYGTADFGAGDLTSAGGADVVLAAFDAKGSPLWSRRYGDSNDQQPIAVGVNGVGYVTVTGNFSGTLTMNAASPLTSTGASSNIFVGGLDTNGNALWSKAFAGSGTQSIKAMAVDSAGNITLVGAYTGTISFGGPPLTGSVAGSTFVARLNGLGQHQWSKSFDSRTYASADATGSVVLAGSLSQATNFGCGTISGEVFVAKLTAAGDCAWSVPISAPGGFCSPSAIAADAGGGVVVIGQLGSDADFGGGPVTSKSKYDVFVARFTPSGTHGWSKGFSVTSTATDDAIQLARSVAVDAGGNVLISGLFSGVIDYGGGELDTAGGADAFVAKLDPEGNHLWSRRFGDANAQAADALATYGTTDVLICGEFSGTLDLGGTPLVSDVASGSGFDGSGSTFLARIHTP